jgi:hypothetical protein
LKHREYNIVIYKMYKDMALSTYICLKKVMWAGHVVKMEEHRIQKKVLGSCSGKGRSVGRPRNRREDVIQKDGSGRLQQEIRRSGGRKLGMP